jgi:hypothetical protein
MEGKKQRGRCTKRRERQKEHEKRSNKEERDEDLK